MRDEAARASEPAVRTPVRGWRAAFPPAQWLAAYRLQWLPHDAIAGVTLPAYGIPVSLAYASLAGLPPQYGLGFKVVGALPTGLPAFHFPGLRVVDVDGVLPLAFACMLLAYVESVSAARALAQAHGDEIDPRHELLGLGAANLVAALFQAYHASTRLTVRLEVLRPCDWSGARTSVVCARAHGKSGEVHAWIRRDLRHLACGVVLSSPAVLMTFPLLQLRRG